MNELCLGSQCGAATAYCLRVTPHRGNCTTCYYEGWFGRFGKARDNDDYYDQLSAVIDPDIVTINAPICDQPRG